MTLVFRWAGVCDVIMGLVVKPMSRDSVGSLNNALYTEKYSPQLDGFRGVTLKENKQDRLTDGRSETLYPSQLVAWGIIIHSFIHSSVLATFVWNNHHGVTVGRAPHVVVEGSNPGCDKTR